MYYVESGGWGRPLETPSVPCLRTYHRESLKRKRRSVSATHVRTYKMIEGGLEYSGYIDIKQPPKIKGRKLKTWKKKWVVMHEMSIRSAGRSAAKVDIYADEKTATESPADKMTFILEFVTDVRQAKSKNRLHAFEVVEKEAVLLLAGATELDTQTWVSKFRKIFFPHKEEIDNFSVVIVINEHSGRLGLQGVYTMTVNPEVVAISSKEHNSYEWSLNMLKRFHLEKDAENPTKELLTIECGPKSECGEATFQFRSDHVTKILDSIKKNIFIALDRKRTERNKTNTPVTEKRLQSSITATTRDNEETRTRSETTCSIENRYKELLENATNKQEKAGQIPFNSQESRESQAESVVSDDAPELPPKKRQNVTFDVSTPEASGADKIDLLDSPNVISTEEESTYNRVDFHQPKSAPKTGNIISMVTVAKPGYETKLLLDDRGYSHVDIQNSKPVISEDKTRSLSNMSSQSSVSCRSASVGSKDSGIIYAKVDKSAKNGNGTQSKRSSNSFDSAVSTSSAVGSVTPSTVDSNATTLTVEVQAVVVTGAELIEHGIQESNDNGIYQDMSLEDNKSISKSDQGGDKLYAKPKLRKSNSAGTFAKDEKENEYEDLDNFRKGKKNLVKHLGMDPQVDPKSVPPSLPERPSSHKVKRKFQNNEKKLFTLPFRSKHRKQKERAVSTSSSSSDSDSESTRDSKKSDDLAVKVWPLGNKSVIAENEDLYQPIAIERYLNDNDGVTLSQKRERSSSLNLNMASAMKRPSITSVTLERSNQVWKHNRNVSMQMDMLNRKNDPNNTMLNVENFDFSFQPGMLIRENDRTSVEMNSDDDRNNDSLDIKSDDEPIYAEVEPVKKSSLRIEDPFPNLTIWKPQDISDVAEVSELNETKYENDDSMNSSNPTEKLELLNQGFVLDDEPKCGSESLLIDLSEPIKVPNTQSGVDIFNMGVGPSFLDTSLLIPTRSQGSATNVSANLIDIFSLGCGTPLPPSSTNLLNSSSIPCVTVSSYNGPHTVTSQTSKPGAESESIYMDMESYNESIYVLPSSINSKN